MQLLKEQVPYRHTPGVYICWYDGSGTSGPPELLTLGLSLLLSPSLRILQHHRHSST